MTNKLIFSFLLVMSHIGYACDICGNFMGLTPFDGRNYIQLLHRYRLFNGYHVYQQPSKLIVPGAYRSLLHGDDTLANHASNTNNTYSTFDYESYKVLELRGKWFFHSRWELNVIAPIVQNKSKKNNNSKSVTALSDPTFMLAYHLVKKLDHPYLKHRLILGLGYKPHLASAQFKSKDGQRIDLLMQPGTGSSDLSYYLNYISTYKNFGCNFNTLFKHSFVNKYGEQLMPAFNHTWVLFYKLNFKNITVIPSITSNYEYTEGLRVGGTLQKGTGMRVALSGPSIDLVLKRFTFSGGYQLRVMERVSSASNLSNVSRFFVAVTFGFDKTAYVFK